MTNTDRSPRTLPRAQKPLRSCVNLRDFLIELWLGEWADNELCELLQSIEEGVPIDDDDDVFEEVVNEGW